MEHNVLTGVLHGCQVVLGKRPALKMKVMFLLLELMLLSVLQAQAKIPQKEYFDAEKVMTLEGIFSWWKMGKLPCLDTAFVREQRSDKAHLHISVRTPAPAGSQSPSGFLAFTIITSGCLSTLMGQSDG